MLAMVILGNLFRQEGVKAFVCLWLIPFVGEQAYPNAAQDMESSVYHNVSPLKWGNYDQNSEIYGWKWKCYVFLPLARDVLQF